jgi:hypothetical protein
MSGKIEMIESLLEEGRAQELFDLLRGASVHNHRRPLEVGTAPPSVEITRLVGVARLHLEFVAKYGRDKTHVCENGAHFFSYPDRFAEWLSRDAPGIDEADLGQLYTAVRR